MKVHAYRFGLLGFVASLCSFAATPTAAVIENRAPLQPNAYYQFPLGSIEPKGWLRKQLEIQATGLTGHLDEFWNDVGPNSGWLGGTGEAWERGPYYLDGLLPLAYELHDPKLLAKAKQWVDWTLTHQRPDGQIGPVKNDDWWPRMVMLKVLTQYQEVTGDPRVIPLMQKYFSYELTTLPIRPLRDWGRYRWQDNAYSVLWLYNRTGDAKLLDLARLLHAQGYDWERQFANFRYRSKETREALRLGSKGPIPDDAMQTHGVNNAMAIKAAPIWWLLTGSPTDRAEVEHQLTTLDAYHGLPNGMFSADEHFAGLDPSQGVELCAVVEMMFSLEQSFAILGDPRLADRLERVAYNALPATLSNDMWSHQYDQQPNQIACTRAHREWSTNGSDSNLFGLEPNFGCCTANLHQGWPKLVESLWVKTPRNGLVTTVYAPSVLHTNLSGVEVSIEEETEYPFRGSVHFTIHASRPVEFPLELRVPGWARSTEVQINGKISDIPMTSSNPAAGEATADEAHRPTIAASNKVGTRRTSPRLASPFCASSSKAQRARRAANTMSGTRAATTGPFCASSSEEACDYQKSFYGIERVWKSGDQVTVTFAMEPRVSRWYHQAAVFERGPLVFALPIKGTWSKLEQHAEKSADWQIVPTTPWNFAVELGECDASVAEHAIGSVPFDDAAPPVTMEVRARRDADWGEHENSASPPPAGPVTSKQPLQELTLVPYGSAKLRITEFPSLAGNSRCSGSGAVSGR